MDNSILKANARKNMQKNHWICVAVAFLMTMGASGFSVPTYNFTFNFPSNSPSETLPSQPFEMPSFENIFSDPAIVPMFIMFGIVAFVTIIISTILKIFVFNTMTVGGSRFFLKLRKNHPAEFSEVFTNFKDKTFLNIAKVTFMRDLQVVLYSFLFIIPGIIKTYEYWAVNYILAVRPDLDYKEALRLSKTIMKGNKLDLFVLELSFIGWGLLSVFTCALLSILYVAPYMQATFAEFFSYIREDAIARGVITPYDIPDYDPYIPPIPTVPFYSTSYEMNAHQPFAQPQNFTQPQNNSVPTTTEYIPEKQPMENTEVTEVAEHTEDRTQLSIQLSETTEEPLEISEKETETPDTTPTSDE